MADNEDRFIVRREVSAAFKINAFMIKRDAQEYCVDILERLDHEKRKRWIEKIIGAVRKQTLVNNLVSRDVLESVIKQIATRNSDKPTSLLNIFDAFSIPRHDFDTDTRKMSEWRGELKLGGDVGKGTSAMRQRFLLVQQRLQRNSIFDQFKFCSVESLIGNSHRLDQVVVLGMLTQQKADTFHIEDLSGSVQVEFPTDTHFHTGLFVEGSIMIFEGSYYSLLFTASAVGLVPPETAQETRSILGNDNWFGGEDKICFRSNEKLVRLGEQNRDAFMAVLSDVHLENPAVLGALRHLLSGYASAPPAAFVFCGNFCARSRQPITIKLLDQGFRRLAAMIMEHKSAYENTHFIFVPGPDDPSVNHVLPRPHLPAMLFKHMQQIPNCSFGSNPVRIQFAAAEIVVMRDDVIEKMCRHCVRVPKKAEEIRDSAVRTLLSNAHLSPLPPHVTPCLWDFDHTLRLHPLPDNLVLADKFEAFSQKTSGCSVLNPGSFFRTPHEFMVMYPLRGEVEASEIGRIVLDPIDSQ